VPHDADRNQSPTQTSADHRREPRGPNEHADRRVAQFYRDVLGFREVARPNFDFPGAWLYNYGIMIHQIYNEAATGPEGEIQTRDSHLALHTDDLEAAERLLKEHGVPYRKNVVADKNIVQIFCRDPDGHHVEIGTYPPTPPFV
jgi:catechol 2,3-dioxygenase-like lactoylglutathione lyase family enzyme